MVKANRFYGFTLVEMLITVAIIGILATIAMPSYNRYIERGYLSQAYADLVSINSNVRTYIVKNPGTKIDSDKLKNIISKSTTAEIAERYDFAGSVPDDKSRRYLLSATPKEGTGYTQALWTDSLGEAYKCTDAASAKAFSTSQTDGKGCERIGKTGI
jgi:prepilin-type N-cleavage/methylation domain protein